MKLHDLGGLWGELVNARLDKPISECSLAELELLADIIAGHADGSRAPYLRATETTDRLGKPCTVRELVIPFDAPFACRWWMHPEMTARQRRDMYRSFGVADEDMGKYIDPRQLEEEKPYEPH